MYAFANPSPPLVRFSDLARAPLRSAHGMRSLLRAGSRHAGPRRRFGSFAVCPVL